jgi:hypothetical protein
MVAQGKRADQNFTPRKGETKMTATFKTLNHAPKFNINHRKENHFYKQFTAIAINKDGRAYDAVTLRIYGTDAKSYACLWTHSNCSWENAKDYWRNGSGSAGGYGYHRASAAAQEAIYNAGIELSEDINGRGDSAIHEAVKAIARAMWDESVYIYITEAHA